LPLEPGDLERCRPQVNMLARRLADQSLHQTAMQMSAYQQVITGLRAAPEPRVLVVLTRGIAAGVIHGELQGQIEPIARAAAEAGVEFYSISEDPETSTELDNINIGAGDQPRPGSETRTAARRSEGRFLTAGIQTVAASAGGEAFTVSG